LGGIQPAIQEEMEDRKPNLDQLASPAGDNKDTNQGSGRKVVKLGYAFDGAPGLPPKWTYPDMTAVSQVPKLSEYKTLHALSSSK
jgi:hypothetical protein